MASISSEVIIKNDLRPCYVDGKKALFHKWGEISYIVPPSPMVGGHAGGVVKRTLAIVEYHDGTVAEVEPTSIIFADMILDEYAFNEKTGK